MIIREFTIQTFVFYIVNTISLQCSENKNLQVKKMNKKRIIRFLKNCLLEVKKKLALLLILRIPTIKKAVELFISIGVLKLTAINFKKQI